MSKDKIPIEQMTVNGLHSAIIRYLRDVWQEGKGIGSRASSYSELLSLFKYSFVVSQDLGIKEKPLTQCPINKAKDFNNRHKGNNYFLTDTGGKGVTVRKNGNLPELVFAGFAANYKNFEKVLPIMFAQLNAGGVVFIIGNNLVSNEKLELAEPFKIAVSLIWIARNFPTQLFVLPGDGDLKEVLHGISQTELLSETCSVTKEIASFICPMSRKQDILKSFCELYLGLPRFGISLKTKTIYLPHSWLDVFIIDHTLQFPEWLGSFLDKPPLDCLNRSNEAKDISLPLPKDVSPDDWEWKKLQKLGFTTCVQGAIEGEQCIRFLCDQKFKRVYEALLLNMGKDRCQRFIKMGDLDFHLEYFLAVGRAVLSNYLNCNQTSAAGEKFWSFFPYLKPKTVEISELIAFLKEYDVSGGNKKRDLEETKQEFKQLLLAALQSNKKVDVKFSALINQLITVGENLFPSYQSSSSLPNALRRNKASDANLSLSSSSNSSPSPSPRSSCSYSPCSSSSSSSTPSPSPRSSPCPSSPKFNFSSNSSPGSNLSLSSNSSPDSSPRPSFSFSPNSSPDSSPSLSPRSSYNFSSNSNSSSNSITNSY